METSFPRNPWSNPKHENFNPESTLTPPPALVALVGLDVEDVGVVPYRGTSLIRNNAPLGPYSRTMPGVL